MARCLLVALFIALGSAGASARHLSPPRWQRLRTGVVKPTRWLRYQAELQAAALTSHLPLFWPNVANTSWLGGNADNDGGLHESTPYWLNGAVPLAAYLGDADLLSTVDRYIEGALSRQSPDGWLGPDTAHDDFWSRYPMLLAFAQRHETLPIDSPLALKILSGASRFFKAVATRLAGGTKLAGWSAARSHDLIWAIHYFVDVLQRSHPEATGPMLDLAERLHSEGFQWHRDWFNSSSFPRRSVDTGFNMYTHGVNVGQAVKHGAVWARQSGDAEEGAAQSWHAWETLMRFHGQPTGVYAADEHLGGRMPSRGTELCAVVESMWSLSLLAQVAPTDSEAARALDALEGLAFNALPGSLSEDTWSHPYLQFANSVSATRGEKEHIWASDGPDAAMYGLAPNYECCTANFHQGYPKFIGSLFFVNVEANALISAVWAPSKLTVPGIGGDAQVELVTDYPFGREVEYSILNRQAFTLRIRLPSFLCESEGPHAGLATVRVWIDGHERTVELRDGFLSYDIVEWPLGSARTAVRITWETPPIVKKWDDRSEGTSIFVGPLLMALDLQEQRRLVQKYEYGAADWDTTTLRPWRYAVPAGGSILFGNLTRRTPGTTPYARGAGRCPLALVAGLARLDDGAWPTEKGSPGALPQRCAASTEELVTLVPYGCSSIRISAFPEASSASFVV